MTGAALCLICQAAEPQPVVCRACETSARRDLDTIGAQVYELVHWNVIDPGTIDHTGRHIGLAMVDSPIITAKLTPDLAAIAAADPRSTPDIDPHDPDFIIPAVHWLIREAAWTKTSRQLAAPLTDVHDAVRILNISFDWSIRTARADDYAVLLGLCVRGLRRALHDHGERTIGHCTAKHGQTKECGGPLRLAYTGPLPLDPDNQIAPTHIECAWCKDRWGIDPATLIGMLRVAAPKSFPIRTSYAAEQLGIPERTIQHWAAVGKIRRHGHGEVDLIDLLKAREGET